jgi:hypothetical protein
VARSLALSPLSLSLSRSHSLALSLNHRVIYNWCSLSRFEIHSAESSLFVWKRDIRLGQLWHTKSLAPNSALVAPGVLELGDGGRRWEKGVSAKPADSGLIASQPRPAGVATGAARHPGLAGAPQQCPSPSAGRCPGGAGGARAKPPFQALGTGALGSPPGRGGAGEGARPREGVRVQRRQAEPGSEWGAHVPEPGSTAAESVNTCGRERDRHQWGSRQGARARTDRQTDRHAGRKSGSQTEPRAPGRARALTGKCRRRALNTSLGGGEAAAPSPACTCPLLAAGTGRLRRRRRLLAGCCCCRLCCSGALRGAPCGISAPRGSSRALRPPGWRGGLRGGRRGAGGARPLRGSWLGAGRPSGRPREASCRAQSGGGMRGGQQGWGAGPGSALRGRGRGRGARLQRERVTAAPSGRPPAHVSSSASLRPCASPPPTTGGGRGVFYARAARGRGAGGGPGPEPAQ